jgi:glycosyltransferase involved in cell wall biosynthesis
MSAYPRLTVITPSYNQAAFLEETIRSVLSQGYPNLEYMIVDGGSNDGSVEIIKKYADRLAWWVSEKDRGQADAINKGFARATGEIVAWINSDDYYLPGAFAEAVAGLQAHPEYGMVYGDVVAIDGEGKPINVMTYGDWGLDELMQFHMLGQPSIFMRRSVLELGGHLDLSYDLLLDHELWLRLAQHAPIHYLPRRWSAARYHPAAKNRAQSANYGKDAYRIVEWMAAHPVLAERYRRMRRKIWAGAYRLDGHYLLDSGQAGAALRAYLRCLWTHPPAALPVARRILFAAASLVVNVDGLRRWYLDRRQRKVSASLAGRNRNVE